MRWNQDTSDEYRQPETPVDYNYRPPELWAIIGIVLFFAVLAILGWQ